MTFSFIIFLPAAYRSSRLAVELELQLPAHATATAMPDLSHICDLPHSSQQCQILNPLSKARGQTHNLMVPNRTRIHCAMTGNSITQFLYNVFYLPDSTLNALNYWYLTLWTANWNIFTQHEHLFIAYHMSSTVLGIVYSSISKSEENLPTSVKFAISWERWTIINI